MARFQLRTGGGWDTLLIYFILEGASSLLIQLSITLYTVYYAAGVGLDAFQIVLMGTIFETTIFLFEVPTGVVADVYSRRLSIIIGIALLGFSLFLMGAVPVPGAILVGEIIMGIGVTFTSGATEAWISDEIGVERAGKAFVRAAQLKTVGAMVGIVVSVALASISLNLPFLVSGVLLMTLAVFLVITMSEKGFQPTPASERSTWGTLFDTFRQGLKQIRLRPILVPIFAITFIIAAHGEGFDHLWQKFMLDNIAFPALGSLKLIVWFGVFSLGANILGIIISEIVRRRWPINPHYAARTLVFVYGISSLGILAFALAGDFLLALAAYWLIIALRVVSDPISKAWLNQHVDSSIRATMFSMNGQVNSLGEMVGGPPVGAIGTLFSLRAALAACGAILALTAPVLLLAQRREKTQA